MRAASPRSVGLALVAAGGASLLAINYLEATFVWCSMAWAGVSFYLMKGRKSTIARVVWFNLGAILVVLGVFEAVVGVTGQGARRQEHWDRWWDSIYVRDDALGHRPQINYHNRCKLYYDGALVFDAAYTIGANGLRVSPTPRADEVRQCLLFFGGSYMFGEGVDDEEAMPYLVGVRSGGRYRIHNFAFSGYGPHQMLAQIETGLVHRVADCEPAYAIYLAHPHHALRAAGKWWWDTHGPRYVLIADDDVQRRGNFDDDAGILERLIARSAWVERTRDNVRPDEHDVALFHAIVQKSRRLLEQAYPGIEFHVVYWDVAQPRLFNHEQWTVGLSVHPVSDIFPERERWEGVYTFENDVHPTAYAHSLLADYLVDVLLTVRKLREAAASALP